MINVHGRLNDTITIINLENSMENLQLLKGKKAKIKGASSGHGMPIGTTGKIEKIHGAQIYLEGCNSWVGRNDIDIIPITTAEIDADIVSLEKEINKLKDQKEYMSINGIDEYDETQFKVFRTLATLDKKDISQLEKSKLIAELIKG